MRPIKQKHFRLLLTMRASLHRRFKPRVLTWWVLVTSIRMHCDAVFAIFSTKPPARGQIQLHSFILRDTGYSLKARITLSRLMRESPETPMSRLAPYAYLTTCDP
jgi:hypothetical protein